MNAQEMFGALMSVASSTGARVAVIGDAIEPPCIVLAPPVLRMKTQGSTPDEGLFGVACCVPFDDRTVVNSIELVMKMLAALDDANEEFVISGDIQPGTIPGNPGTYPAYLIDIEAVLT